MSRTTVHYIQLPKLKSLLTSCRRAKARCETLLFKTKPRRREEGKWLDREPALTTHKETPTRAAAAEPAAPETK